MRILVVSQYFFPEQFRINEIVSALVRYGNRVTVLTGRPNYPGGEIFEDYQDSHQCISDYNGAVVYRCKLRPRHKGTVNLVKNYLSFVRQSKKTLKTIQKDFDVVYVYGLSPVTQALPAIKLKKKLGIPVYFYCMDLWPEAVLGEQNGHAQISRANPIYVFAKAISKYVYNRVDKIGVKCPAFLDYNHTVCGIPKEKMHVLYEHAEARYLSVPEIPTENRTLDYMYLGNIGKAQNCDQILYAFSKVRSDKPIKLHFVGGGSDLQTIKDLTNELDLNDRVVFHGHCSVEKVVDYYEYADVCILSLSSRSLTGETIPGKLTGYMAAGRPIIAAINGISKTIIEDARCGYVCQADDVDALAALMQKVADDPECLASLGKNGREYFNKHFTLEMHMNGLLAWLEELVNRGNVREER